MSLPLEALLEGKYEILDKIAEGGMGSIYKVRHKLLEETRVIKVLRAQVADRADLHKRLMQEAKTAIRLEHPSIARLFDLAVAEDGTAYIVMEFIEGVSLDSLLEAGGPPSIELCVEIARQSLRALDYLHESGFIHRDISPDNLMLTRDFTGRVRVKLIDLGIAKDLAEETGVTAVGSFLGKVKYCAPELFKDGGVKHLDQRSDNYSLAITLYELLTGRPPFTGETFEELAAGHLFHEPTRFEVSDPQGRVPQPLRDVILRALAKDPAERPASAKEFAGALEQFEINEAELAREFERAVGTTTRFLSKFRKYSAGATQDHLNAQFGLERTSAAEARSLEAPAKPRAPETAEAEPTPTVPIDMAPDRRASREGARPSSGAWRWAALPALAIAAGALWWALERAPASDQSITRPPVTVIPAERFDPEDTGDVVNAPVLPVALQGSANGPGEPASAAAADSSPPASGSESAALDPQPVDDAAAERQAPLLKPGPGVVAPRLLDVLEPSDPKPDRKEVVVVVSALVAHSGRVLTATVKSGPSFRRRYREVALAAVEAARFEPATANGEPGKMWVDVEVTFKP